MYSARLVPLGFLIVSLFLTVAPALFLAGLQHVRQIDGSLHNIYYIVAPWQVALSYPAASALFAAIYWIGPRFGLGYSTGLAWSHLILWTIGSAMLFAPQFVVPLMSPPDFSHAAGDFARLHTLSTVGYSVTLISLAVFAICIGKAILRRNRRAKPL
ncbi:MAG: hypothetical protein ACK4MQ_09755 [Hyphomonas sp.]